jgi:hypothetical protein
MQVLDKARNIVLTRASQMQKPHLTRVQTVKKMFSKSAVAKLKSKAKTQISWLASKVTRARRFSHDERYALLLLLGTDRRSFLVCRLACTSEGQCGD